MDTHSKKLSPFQGITLLFLLLVIPVGVYVGTQYRSIADTRSQAGDAQISMDGVTGANLWAAAPAPAAAAPAPAAVTPATPTPTSPPTVRCNKTCTVDTDCSKDGDMGCIKVDGVGKCRNSQCSTVSDCWCNKTVSCNTTCTQDDECGGGKVCVKINGSGKCRSKDCFEAADCLCYTIGGTPTPTSTPTPTPLNRCNNTCASDAECGESMVCTKTTKGNKCRNSQCYGTEDCICYSAISSPTPILSSDPIRITTLQPTPMPTIIPMLLADLLSTPIPTPSLLQRNIAPPLLTIDPFYNAKKQANPMVSLSGTSDPEAELDISVFPDGIVMTVTADSLGNWQYVLPKKLTNGDKQLTIISRTNSGGQMTKTETFTVVGGFQFPFAAVVFSFLIALGVGGYLLYQKNMNKNQPPPSDPVLTTTSEFVPPEAIVTEEPVPSVPIEPFQTEISSSTPSGTV